MNKITPEDFDTIVNIEEDQSLYVLDEQYYYLFYNVRHKKEMLEAFNAEIEVGQSKLAYLPQSIQGEFLKLYQGAFSKELSNYTLKFNEDYLEFKFFPFAAGSSQKLLVKSRLVTDEIKVKQELEKYREQLEEIVKKRTEEVTQQRDFLQHLIDEDPSLIFLRDGRGIYRLVNKSLAGVLGKQPFEVVGKHAKALSKKEELLDKYLLEDQKLLEDGGSLDVVRPFSAEDHKDLWLSVRKKRVEIEGEYLILGVMSNITDLVNTQQSLENSNSELGQTISDLKEMQVRLVTTEKIASILLLTSGFMHEISNPINYVAGNVQPLKRDIGELKEWVSDSGILEEKPELKNQFAEVSQEIDVLINGIEEGTQRVKSLVQNLKKLSYNHPETEGLVNFHEIFEGVLTMLSFMMEEKELLIDRNFTQQDIQVFTNPSYLNQLLINVIDFVISRMQSGEKLILETALEKSELVIDIKDKARKLPEEEITRMKMPFEKIEEGTKVGLAVSNRIAQKIRGTIEPYGESGITHFRVKIPINSETTPV